MQRNIDIENRFDPRGDRGRVVVDMPTVRVAELQFESGAERMC